MQAIEHAVHSSKPRPLATFLNPVTMMRNLWSHRELTWQLAKRDIEGRYRTSRLGLLWAVLTPLCLLAIYTFVFTVVLSIRWGDDPGETRGEFALTLFCGMLLYGWFAEVVNRAPTMIAGNPNYVKKVVFPLEVLIVSALISGLINMLIGYGAWLVGWGLIARTWLDLSAVYFPVVLVPVCLTTLGVSWVLASVGVFVRDVGHAVALATQMLFFVTPIFYSIDRIPERFRWPLAINPLAHAIEDVRRVLMRGEPPDWYWWAGATAGSAVLAVLGYAFFMKSKRAFADVV